jgi:hypothetical protein
MSYEQKEILSRQISEHLSARPQQKFEGIDRVKVEIAELLTIRFPPLLSLENRDALLMAVELRFEEVRNAIQSHEYERSEAAEHARKVERHSRETLFSLGVIADEIAF